MIVVMNLQRVIVAFDLSSNQKSRIRQEACMRHKESLQTPLCNTDKQQPTFNPRRYNINASTDAGSYTCTSRHTLLPQP
jgi:hypothetical protein